MSSATTTVCIEPCGRMVGRMVVYKLSPSSIYRELIISYHHLPIPRYLYATIFLYKYSRIIKRCLQGLHPKMLASVDIIISGAKKQNFGS